jgi:heme-degrading monooxygenase HmoA
MFARVSHARYPPEQYDAGLRVVMEDLLPAFRRAPGYRGCCFLASSKPGSGLAVVVWETEEAADAASAVRSVGAAHAKLGALGLAIASRQIFEVVVYDERFTGPAGISAGERSTR